MSWTDRLCLAAIWCSIMIVIMVESFKPPRDKRRRRNR